MKELSRRPLEDDLAAVPAAVRAEVDHPRLHRTGAVYVLDEPTTGLHMADGQLDALALAAGPGPP
ncbi:hypothetical protein ABT373_27550 [Streptomyces sp. NPDC000070]|uniref:hypothetical protein n=1 Tax=Streptomyces sp. NPDC000070 TaxID=3154240 RepID=UPI0033183EC9